MQLKTQSQSIGRIILTIAKWVFSILLILVFFGSLLQKAYLTSIFWLLLGLFLLPPLSKYWKMLPLLSNRFARIGFAVVLFFAAAFTIPKKEAQNRPSEISKSENTQHKEPKKAESEKKKELKSAPPKINNSAYSYKVMENENVGAVQNLSVVISTEDISKENIQKIAEELRQNLCSQSCNISIYDDKKAWELNREYDELEYDLGKQTSIGKISQSQFRKKLNNWDKKNYCVMAEHMPGFLSFESDEIFYYMLKDSKYRELKNEAD